jgi:hypothetical protein
LVGVFPRLGEKALQYRDLRENCCSESREYIDQKNRLDPRFFWVSSVLFVLEVQWRRWSTIQTKTTVVVATKEGATGQEFEGFLEFRPSIDIGFLMPLCAILCRQEIPRREVP